MFNFLNLHQRTIILTLLILISISCWFYTIAGVGMTMSAWEMTLINLNINEVSNSMKIMNSHDYHINFSNMIFIFLMWFLMMIAMMLPTAIPFIMIFDKISNERITQRWERYARPKGFELEKKIGYKELKVELGNNTRTLFRPILPLDEEWETMTQTQRDALYLELKKKSEELQERNDSSQMIDEKLRMIEKEMDFD